MDEIKIYKYKDAIDREEIALEVKKDDSVIGVSCSNKFFHLSEKTYIVLVGNQKAVLKIKKEMMWYRTEHLGQGIYEFRFRKSDIEEIVSELKEKLEKEFAVKIISKEKVPLKTG